MSQRDSNARLRRPVPYSAGKKRAASLRRAFRRDSAPPRRVRWRLSRCDRFPRREFRSARTDSSGARCRHVLSVPVRRPIRANTTQRQPGTGEEPQRRERSIRPPQSIDSEIGIGAARHIPVTRTSLMHEFPHDITPAETERAGRWKRLLKKFWDQPICYALNFVYARTFLYL